MILLSLSTLLFLFSFTVGGPIFVVARSDTPIVIAALVRTTKLFISYVMAFAFMSVGEPCNRIDSHDHRPLLTNVARMHGRDFAGQSIPGTCRSYASYHLKKRNDTMTAKNKPAIPILFLQISR